MGKRSRKRSSQPAAGKPKPKAPASRPKPRPAPEDGPAENGAAEVQRGYARSRARDEAARAALTPLAEGERPRAVTGAAIYAIVLAVAQVVTFIAGDGLDESRSAAIGPGLFVIVMLVAAWGCWHMRYWAVLGMQALFALTILYFSIIATRASGVVDVLIVLAFVVPAGVLFWYLVKAMARIQMPDRP